MTIINTYNNNQRQDNQTVKQCCNTTHQTKPLSRQSNTNQHNKDQHNNVVGDDIITTQQ